MKIAGNDVCSSYCPRVTCDLEKIRCTVLLYLTDGNNVAIQYM